MTPTKIYHSCAEVCQLTGLPACTLRYWETQFMQLSPYKDEHGHTFPLISGQFSWTDDPQSVTAEMTVC